MEWLKELVKSLPLEDISEVLAKVVFAWIQLVDGVPEERLALYTYLGASFLVLFFMYWLLKAVPRVLRAPIWIITAAVLLTPGATIGDTDGNAPAIIGVLHSFLMGEPALAMAVFLPILAVIIAGLIVAALWQFVQAALNKPNQSTSDEAVAVSEAQS